MEAWSRVEGAVGKGDLPNAVLWDLGRKTPETELAGVTSHSVTRRKRLNSEEQELEEEPWRGKAGYGGLLQLWVQVSSTTQVRV